MDAWVRCRFPSGNIVRVIHLRIREWTMSDLSFVAGEFPRLASTAREAAEAVRSARPEGGASAFASAMPGTNLSSKMQGVEEKFADQATKTGTSLDEHAESLLAAERGFIAAEDETGQLIGSILQGHS